MNAQELMTRAIEAGASDLHLTPGRPPVGRVDGKLVPLVDEELTDAQAATLCRELCDDKHWAELESVAESTLPSASPVTVLVALMTSAPLTVHV